VAVPQNVTTELAGVSSGIFLTGSQVYFVGNSGAATREVQVWMVADPSAGSFALQDSSNQPNLANWNEAGATIDGTDLIIVHGEDQASGDVRLSVFHGATDLWSALVDGDYEDLAFTGATQGVDGNASQPIHVMRDLRTTGDPLVCMYMHEEKDMGTDYRNYHVGSRAATTGDAAWTHRGRVTPTNGVAYVHGGLALGTSNITHCFFGDVSGLYHRTFNSGWTLNGTTQTVSSDVVFSDAQMQLQTRYDVASTIHIVIAWEDASGSIRAGKADSAESSAASWTIEVVSDADATGNTRPCAVRNGTTVHVFWADTNITPDAVFRDEQADGDTTWGTDENVHSENLTGGLAYVAQDPLDYGSGDVIPFVMIGATATAGVYDEWALPAGAVSIPVPAGSLTLAGQLEVVARGIPVPVGALVLAGLTPTASQTIPRNPGVGTLSLAGQTPTRIEAHLKAMPAGSLVLAGVTPTRVENSIRQPGAGALVLAGVTPTPDHGSYPPAGALGLAGLAPTAFVPLVIEVPKGVLTASAGGHAFPSTSVLDDFDRADEDPATGWSWTVGDEGQVLSNEAGASNADGVVSGVHTATGDVQDCEAYLTLRAGGALVALVHARNQSSTGGFDNTYEVLYNTAGNVQLVRRQSGFNDLGTVVTGRSPQAGDCVGIRVIGTRLEAWLKRVGESWERILTATDTAFTSGYIGFGSGSDDARRWDDFGGGEISGDSPSLDFGLHPAAGDLTLGGATPALAFTVHPGAGALVFTGETPGVGVDQTALPGAGTLVLAGQLPQVLVPVVMAMGVGLLATHTEPASIGFGIAMPEDDTPCP
jgi:hypothetical protein